MKRLVLLLALLGFVLGPMTAPTNAAPKTTQGAHGHKHKHKKHKKHHKRGKHHKKHKKHGKKHKAKNRRKA